MISIVIFARFVQYSVIVAIVQQSVFLIVSHSPVRKKTPTHSSERCITCGGIVCRWKFWGPLGFGKDVLENLSQMKLFMCTLGVYRGEVRFLHMKVASSEN